MCYNYSIFRVEKCLFYSKDGGQQVPHECWCMTNVQHGDSSWSLLWEPQISHHHSRSSMSDVGYGRAVLVLRLHCRFLMHNCVPIYEIWYSNNKKGPLHPCKGTTWTSTYLLEANSSSFAFITRSNVSLNFAVCAMFTASFIFTMTTLYFGFFVFWNIKGKHLSKTSPSCEAASFQFVKEI